MRRMILLLIILFVVIGAFFGRRALTHPFPTQASKAVIVNQAKPIDSLVAGLASIHIAHHPRLLGMVLKLVYKSSSLHAGEYVVKPDDNLTTLIQRIQVGRVIQHHFLMVEGWTIQRVLNKLAADPSLTHTLGTHTKGLMKRLGLSSKPAEGLFFPDTYFFRLGTTDKRILLLSYYKMQRELAAVWKKRAKGLAYKKPYQALIAASLIEKETASAKERPLVAAVINNRLKKHMRLQIDQSVVYGLRLPYGSHLTRSMLKKKTPYNTYLRAGLPPTPIALPSLASLKAACHPAKSHVLYYVLRADGTQQFSRTYHRHLTGVKALHHREARVRSGEELLDSMTAVACLSATTVNVLSSLASGNGAFSRGPLGSLLCDTP